MSDRPKTETPGIWRDRKRYELETEVKALRDLLIEQLGRDGSSGAIWKQFSNLEESRDKQGARIGKVEGKVSSLTIWKAQAAVIAILVLSLFGAFSKELMAKLFGQ